MYKDNQSCMNRTLRGIHTVVSVTVCRIVIVLGDIFRRTRLEHWTMNLVISSMASVILKFWTPVIMRHGYIATGNQMYFWGGIRLMETAQDSTLIKHVLALQTDLTEEDSGV